MPTRSHLSARVLAAAGGWTGTALLAANLHKVLRRPHEMCMQFTFTKNYVNHACKKETFSRFLRRFLRRMSCRGELLGDQRVQQQEQQQCLGFCTPGNKSILIDFHLAFDWFSLICIYTLRDLYFPWLLCKFLRKGFAGFLGKSSLFSESFSFGKDLNYANF